MFNEREKFVMMMTAMVTSEKAKEHPREVRQKILAFMRDKYCSSVDDESWAQIAKDINETKELLMSETMKYIVSSMNNDGSMKEGLLDCRHVDVHVNSSSVTDHSAHLSVIAADE